MPITFKLTSKLLTRWNEQGKRPRENTVQYEDVVAAFATAESKEDDDAMMVPNPRNSKLTQAELAKINNEHTIPDTTTTIPLVTGGTVLVGRRSKLGQTGDHAKVHAYTAPVPSVEVKTPEQEQREMVQSIAARVLFLQQPDIDIDYPQYGGVSCDQRQLAFVGSRVPAISFVKYVERLVHNINRWAHEAPGTDSVGVQSGIFAIEYLERAQGVKVTPKSIHRYFLGAFLAGIKFNFDYYLSGTFWAGVGGVRVEELNFLETEFFAMLNWNLYVSPEVYNNQFTKTKMF